MSEAEREQVLASLHAALQSSAFSNAQRARDFLQFVVERAIAGEREQLKERVIGVAIFRRAPDYSTGEDSVVRVQASDVRRRLDRFNQSDEAGDLPVIITLPTGTYCPQFRFVPKSLAKSETSVSLQTIQDELPAMAIPAAEAHSQRAFRLGGLQVALLLLGGVLLVLGGFVLGRHQVNPVPEDMAMVRFWRPLSASGRAILLCIPRTASYRLTNAWYAGYRLQHPGEFDEEWERLNLWPTLNPDTPLKMVDLQQMADHGLGAGDVYSATTLAAALAKVHLPFQVRIGHDYQYEDIRKSPSVLIGGFNNRWTMQLGASLPFHFQQIGQEFAVAETGGAHRVWIAKTIDGSGHWADYALVARILRSDTGQPLLILAGTGRPGTEISGEFVTDNTMLERALATLPRDWESKNVIFVLRTRSTDGVADPPEVIASRAW